MGTKVSKHLISTWNRKGGAWRLTRKSEGVTGPGYNLRGGLGCESERGGLGSRPLVLRRRVGVGTCGFEAEGKSLGVSIYVKEGLDPRVPC